MKECSYVYPFYEEKFAGGGAGLPPLSRLQRSRVPPEFTAAWELLARHLTRTYFLLPRGSLQPSQLELAVVQIGTGAAGSRRQMHKDKHGDFIVTITLAGEATVDLEGVTSIPQGELDHYAIYGTGITGFRHGVPRTKVLISLCCVLYVDQQRASTLGLGLAVAKRAFLLGGVAIALPTCDCCDAGRFRGL